MSRFRIYPYRMGSASAKVLTHALTGRRRALRVHSRGRYVPRKSHTIINWGSSTPPEWDYSCMLNQPEAARIAGNKLLFFIRMQEAGLDQYSPAWTTDSRAARAWLEDSPVVARHQLSGHSGAGICVWEDGEGFEEAPPAPLYTGYIKKKLEYRIHVAGGEVISLQQKRAREDMPREQCNYRVRSYNNGWVYCVNNVEPPPLEAYTAAAACVAACGLDFGAADVVIHARTRVPYVLEVNTAPGLCAHSTLAAYVSYMQSL